MTTEPFELRVSQPGTEIHEEIMGLASLFHKLAIVGIEESADPRNQMATAAVAASVFAGIVFGQLLAAGVVSGQDRRRWIDSVARNARQGIDIGKTQALRSLTSGLTKQ